jgi:hypothetical protein
VTEYNHLPGKHKQSSDGRRRLWESPHREARNAIVDWAALTIGSELCGYQLTDLFGFDNRHDLEFHQVLPLENPLLQ